MHSDLVLWGNPFSFFTKMKESEIQNAKKQKEKGEALTLPNRGSTIKFPAEWG